jgi:hypothetical protein
MKFYEIDNALLEAINAADKPVRVKIEIRVNGHYESVFEQDIVEANFFSLKEAAGGVSSRGELLLDNPQGIYSYSSVGADSQVKVSFSIGEGLPYFQRFIFYLDDNGVQDIRGPGRRRFVRLGLRDLSAVLRKTDEANDWTAPAVFTYNVICNKSLPQKSLIHGIAQRAGLAVNDIDCSTIPVTLPYVRLRKNIWAELSSLATAYRCHLECPVEKPLVFAHSPYQVEPLAGNEYSYTFTGSDIFYLRKMARAELYRNSIRLKINLPVSLEKQEIWKYDDPPVFYDDFLQAHYPFRYPFIREIEAGNYEARYRVIDANGKERNVIYADEVDTREGAQSRLDYDGGPFAYSYYDVYTHHDRAILTLSKNADGDLYHASIHGRPIVLDLNRSFFIRYERGISQYGTVALNVTGAYFSEYEVNGHPHYEDWVVRELAERLQRRREFTVKTHRALFHARVGAKVKVTVNSEQLKGTINAFSLCYKRDSAFVAAFRITETGGNSNEGE